MRAGDGKDPSYAAAAVMPTRMLFADQAPILHILQANCIKCGFALLRALTNSLKFVSLA